MLSKKRQQANQRWSLYHQERPDSATDVLLWVRGDHRFRVIARYLANKAVLNSMNKSQS